MKTHTEFSGGGCWGQPKLIFWKLVNETQISKPQEYTVTFKQNLTCIFLSVRVNLKETFQCETPCILTTLVENHEKDISNITDSLDNILVQIEEIENRPVPTTTQAPTFNGPLSKYICNKITKTWIFHQN